MAAMKQQNFSPNVGSFGIGGPFNQGWGSLDNGDATEVVYFQKTLETKAAELSALASKILFRPVKTTFFDPSSLPKDDNRSVVLYQSGLDMQLVLGR